MIISYRSLKSYKYQLMETYSLQTQFTFPDTIITPFIELTKTGKITVNKYYAWDGPSGPTIDTKTFMRASLIHDALYQLIREHYLNMEYKKIADLLLKQLCLEDGMCRFRAWYVYIGVRTLGFMAL